MPPFPCELCCCSAAMAAGERRVTRSREEDAYFIKVLRGDFQQFLKIPPDFLKHIPKEAYSGVFLNDAAGGIWDVGLCETMDGTFLACGWSNFVTDHSLRENDLLMFRYDGSMIFSVRIFDKTACEREYAYKVVCRQNSTYHKQKNIKYAPDASLQPDKHSCLGQETETGGVQGKQETFDSAICGSSSRCKNRRGKSTRRHVTVDERELAKRAAYRFNSMFPYMIICMKNRHLLKHELRLPVGFSHMHLPHKKTDIILRDPTGKVWVVNYIPAKTCYFSRGWASFAQVNHLEEGDYCVFELVAPVELNVHVFKVIK